MEYKLIKSSRGIRYMKGSKFCKKEAIPESILQRLLNEETVDTSGDCIFCGQPGTERKLLNSKMIPLCLADYQTRTTGEVAERLHQDIANPIKANNTDDQDVNES